jgi:hypothetical protein
MKKIIIGITDCSNIINYEKWIMNASGVEVIRYNKIEDSTI